MMTPFDGTMSLTLKGTPEKPITIKAAGDGEVIFDGAGNHRLFDVMASQYHIFDGLTIRNTDVAIFAGQKEVLGAVGLTVKNCRFENVGFGVWTEYAGSSDFYIADNLFLGRDDRFRLIGWTGPLWASAGAYGSHLLTSYYAIKVYGPGHVIAHNAIAYFHDGIGISTYGTPAEDPEQQASSIDIYNNDMHMLNDDFVETDGGVHNVRVMNNRGVNAAQGGYSSQPVFGGPVYFIGNILYHVPTGVAFKFSAKPAGLFVYHNTIIGEQVVRDPSSNMHFRNNLFLGRDTPGPRHHDLGERDGRLQLGLQRLSPEQGRDRSNTPGWRRQPGSALRAQARGLEELRDAGRLPRGDRAGDARHRSRFRHLRESGSARSRQPPRRLSRHGPELPAQARQQGGGCGRPDSDRERRLHRPRSGPGRTGSWASPNPGTARAGSPGSRFTDSS